MLRIGKLADYGLLIADCLARAAAQLTTEAIVRETGVPEATVRKLLTGHIANTLADLRTHLAADPAS